MMLTSYFGSFLNVNNSDKKHEHEMAVASAVQAIYVAIFAHENLKHRLQTFVEGTSKEVFTSHDIYFADRSEMGKWMQNVGKVKFAHIPAYAALVEHQKMFHYAAANVISQLEAGKQAEAVSMLAGQFEHFSDALITNLLQLRETVESGRKVGNRANSYIAL